LDSGFCVLVLIAALTTKGLFANAQIKKRRYWPKHLPIKDIENAMEAFDVGQVGYHCGSFLGKPIFIIYMKDEEYNAMFMAGFAPDGRAGKTNTRCGGLHKFQYSKNHAECVTASLFGELYCWIFFVSFLYLIGAFDSCLSFGACSFIVVI
jgi:hypothetical protein